MYFNIMSLIIAADHLYCRLFFMQTIYGRGYARIFYTVNYWTD